MGFWNKLGKIGLAAAPYVAAPFTGGASLAFAPMTSGALQTWNTRDANKAMQKGQAPSKFDSAVGLGSGIAGMAGGMGAFGGGKGLGPSGGFMGPQQGGGGGFMGKMGGMVNQVSPFIQQMMQRQPPMQNHVMPSNPNSPQMDLNTGQSMPGQFMQRGQNMRTPNLSNPFEQGANEGRASRGLGPRRPTMY